MAPAAGAGPRTADARVAAVRGRAAVGYAPTRRRSRRDEALRHLETARSHADDNPFTHYNIGLIYLELSAFEQARAQALKARELGFPRTDLIDRLKAANQWSEPAPASPASASSGP